MSFAKLQQKTRLAVKAQPLIALALCLVMLSCTSDPLEVGSDSCARKYPIAQLQEWHDKAVALFDISGVIMTDMDEVKQCVMIGIADTGLGLTIVHDEVQRMGAEIEFTSTEGVGTVFRFTLPLVCTQSDAAPDSR